MSGIEGASAQLEAIRALTEVGLPGAWAVKDSYGTLDLAPLGFRVLFEAEWLHRPAALGRPDADTATVRWRRIADASGLHEWEVAWAGGILQTQHPRVFVPALLRDEQVAVIAGEAEGRITAGAIANRTGDVVGVSNLFVPSHDAERVRAACIAAVMDVFPGLDLVGYESGQELIGARALGFEPLGPLRVWMTGEAAARP